MKKEEASIQIYWSSIFVLPKKIIKLLEQEFNRFLGEGLLLLIRRPRLLGSWFVFLEQRVVWVSKG